MFHETSGGAAGPFYLGSRRLAKWCERRVLRRAPFVLPISKALGRYAVRSGARPETIRVIPHGLRSNLPDAAPEHREAAQRLLRPGAVNLVLVSRIEREKRIFDILEIADELDSRSADYCIIICGDGSDRAALESAVAQRPHPERFRMPGFLPAPQVAALMQLADVNLNFQGAFALGEAALSGKPVVAYRMEGNEELITHERTGLLVAPGDAAAAAHAVLRLASDHDLAARLGAAAREVAFQQHGYDAAQDIKRRVMAEIIGLAH